MATPAPDTRFRRVPALFILSLLALLPPPPATATMLGSIRGVVNDAARHPVADAQVELRSRTSEWVQTTTSDARGSFSFATVPLGDYLLSISRSGFVTAREEVTVLSGASPVAQIQLAPLPTLETVTISAVAAPAPETATPTTLVSRQDIEQTPGADRSNSQAIITDFVPGAYVVHDQLHVRGGHQTAWAIDGVEIPNTNIASNLGPQIDPKDIDYLEVQRGSYEADQGDRTYGVFNVVPRTGFERDNEAELVASAGSFGQTNDYLSLGSHTDRFAYYVSVNGNRSDLGIQTPVAQIIHDAEDGYGSFASFVYQASPADQLRLVASVRRDDYQIPNTPGLQADDVQREADAFAILSWVRTFNADTVLTTSVFYHYNRADLDGATDDYPISTTDQRSSSYVGGQETLQWHAGPNQLQVGVMGFSQHDHHYFNLLFNDGSGAPVDQTLSPSGELVAVYIEDAFKPLRGWTVTAGVRQTHFAGGVVEDVASPRFGTTFVLPGLGWILRGFYGEYYQAPPLETLSGPLLAYAQNSNLAFLPLRGERDKERQFGVTIPVHGWMIDADHFSTQASNFFDHNPIGNSDVFLPITIQGAQIHAWELTVRSPRFWETAQLHIAYSNQEAEGFGAINGGLTDFTPAGFFDLDHDQRNTVNVGLETRLPWQSYLAFNVYSGSGFANGQPPPSHLPGHTELDVSLGKALSRNLSVSLTALNLTDRHLLIDNSLTFGGFHYNDPRQVYAALHYRFGY